jgi:hypothetical protein
MRVFLRNDDYQGHFSGRARHANIAFMSTGTGPARYKCAQCEQPEASCECDKFCCLCQTVIDVRICADGLMYCEPCRTACEYKTSD